MRKLVDTVEDLQAVRILSVERRSESNAEFVWHVPWNKSGGDPAADGELPDASQAPSAAAIAETGSVDPPRVIFVNTKELHRVSSTSRRKMLRSTDTPRVAQVVGQSFKEAQGKLTRWSAEKGSGT